MKFSIFYRAEVHYHFQNKLSLTFKSLVVTVHSTRLNIKKLYMVLILHLHMCFLWILGQMATFALYKINRLVLIMEVESVSCMVHTKSYVKQIRLVFKGLIIKII